MDYKWNGLPGHKTGQRKNTIKDLDKWTIQTYKTTELNKTNTTDDNTRWYNRREKVNRNSYVDSI